MLYSSADEDDGPLTSGELLRVEVALRAILDRWAANEAATIGAQGELAAAAHGLAEVLIDRQPAPTLADLGIETPHLGDLGDLASLDHDPFAELDDLDGPDGLGRIDFDRG